MMFAPGQSQICVANATDADEDVRLRYRSYIHDDIQTLAQSLILPQNTFICYDVYDGVRSLNLYSNTKVHGNIVYRSLPWLIASCPNEALDNNSIRVDIQITECNGYHCNADTFCFDSNPAAAAAA